MEERKVETMKKERCKDRQCPTHGTLKARGRIFKGRVIKR